MPVTRTKSQKKPATKKAAVVKPSAKAPSQLRVRFWGVRGSVAVPGEGTMETGGNTSCVEVRAAGQTIIFDMGTGLRALGAALLKEGPVKAHLFVSHYHWDHIVGLPFFGPAYIRALS